ncbi:MULTISPECIES: cyclic nucleotide-binding domain-containing protein [Brucella]|uniref:cAMP-binding proteins - catabolite gene activator and regulatory subunit of cAMP-dependent protein kinases n=1 Tax=Ochrobactrum soli TaxID=2448455 RepID=A0A2P9HCY9_9HYPH|nr:MULTISPECIES: cyclic nucleotide-binding domain-containing protein [Brucella]MDX4072276.1 cyclic nucleotide-binding domain-containing protein [Brucella sp. NBRC 113783]SPL61966.1 cAMP-binding proteins - catabolite gene activator and regulatory subunit of cAMP-dependent protein kinases [[Ochrobactrum] soli]
MLLKDEVEMLRRMPFFAGIEPAKLKLLAFTSERVTFKPGETLFHQGDISDSAYVILLGGADILVDSPGGPIKVADAQPNSIVGEIGILCDMGRTATVRAATPLETLRISKEHFTKILGDYPEMAITIMRELAKRLGQTTAELTQERSRNQNMH